MSSKKRDKDAGTVTGIFAHHVDAAEAVQRLEDRGFDDSDISLLMSDTLGDEFKIENTTKAPEGAAAGAISGGLIGALAGGLTAVGTIATGGAGILVAGPIVAALAGAGAGAGAGGLIGGLIGYGFSEYEAKLFAEELEDGKVLVAVHCADDDRTETAKRVLETSGAESTTART